MQTWMPFFVAVTALAVVLQAVILLALYLDVRRTSKQLTRIVNDLHARISPILMRVQILVEDAQPRISEMLADVSHIVHVTRGQAQRVDRIFTDSLERLRGQLVHGDRILTGVLEAVEEFGSKFRHTVWGPVFKASAMLKGFKVGLDFFRDRRRAPEESAEPQTEEELFI
jgi:hypothetical protein